MTTEPTDSQGVSFIASLFAERDGDPLFLARCHDVRARAIRVNLVLLVGLLVAAWATSGAAFLGNLLFQYDEFRIVLAATWPIAITAFVYGPLQWWTRRSVGAILLTAAVWLFLMIVFIYWIEYAVIRYRGEFVALIVGFPVVAAGAGLTLIRRTRVHLLAFVLAIAGSALTALIVEPAEDARNQIDAWIGDEHGLLILRVAILGAWLGSMTLPWGLPFWWPPEEKTVDGVDDFSGGLGGGEEFRDVDLELR